MADHRAGKVQQFADDRGRTRVHTPGNMVHALTGEVSELAALRRQTATKRRTHRADQRTGGPRYLERS
jgi:hypothetical protein